MNHNIGFPGKHDPKDAQLWREVATITAHTWRRQYGLLDGPQNRERRAIMRELALDYCDARGWAKPADYWTGE